MTEVLAALASSGGTALVTAMARFARLLGRGDPARTESEAGRLEQSRAALALLSGPGLQQARVEQEIVWRTRLEDLLEHDPSAVDEPRKLVVEMQAAGSAGLVQRHVAAFDQAQRAVVGHGVQNVTFGRHGQPGASGR